MRRLYAKNAVCAIPQMKSFKRRFKRKDVEECVKQKLSDKGVREMDDHKNLQLRFR